MKRLVNLALIIICAISFNSISSCGQKNSGSETGNTQTNGVTVYICNSSGAKVYHSSSSCWGLNKCTHGVIEVSKSDAISNYGRRACKICY